MLPSELRPPRDWESPARLARPLGPLRRVHVTGDLVDQRLLAVEHLLVAEAPPQLDDQALAVEIAGEAEQEGLDPQLVAAVVRVDADRDRCSAPS